MKIGAVSEPRGTTMAQSSKSLSSGALLAEAYRPDTSLRHSRRGHARPVTISSFQRCGGTGPWHLPTAGLAAAVRSNVREDDRENNRIARCVGPDNTDKPQTALYPRSPRRRG